MLEAMVFREPIDRGLRLVGVAVELGPVAGRYDRGFLHGAMVDQVAQRHLDAVALEGHLLAHGERSGVVVDPDGEELHAAKTALARKYRDYMRLGCRGRHGARGGLVPARGGHERRRAASVPAWSRCPGAAPDRRSAAG